VRVGVSLRTGYTLDDHRLGAQWVVERARAARDAGLDTLFVGDHHATGPFPYYQNVPMMGRLLAEWDDRSAGVLMLLPLWNAVLAAEQLGTLASIARGRFILQCSIGDGEQQFLAMGASLRTRGKHFEAALDTIRRLLAGDDVDGTRVAPTTPEPLEVWIGATAHVGIDRAARLAEGWLANAHVVREEAREQADQYREACAQHGRRPTAVAIRRDVHVGADAADAARVAEPVIAAGYRGFRPDACTYGGIEQVAERFAEYAAMGYTDVIVRHLADDHTEVLRSFERLAAVRELVRGA
jgi:alkanesulfonate monooxygenase SsuD/methylene tetrahydromethanopterin reductase-like flavin-dependent oxidoreductase (luciferase family)